MRKKMHFKITLMFWWSVIWVINSTIPLVQTTERLQLRQHWSSSHNRMILFTKYNKEKTNSKQTRTINPIYIVGLNQSPVEADDFFLDLVFPNPKKKSVS